MLRQVRASVGTDIGAAGLHIIIIIIGRQLFRTGLQSDRNRRPLTQSSVSPRTDFETCELDFTLGSQTRAGNCNKLYSLRANKLTETVTSSCVQKYQVVICKSRRFWLDDRTWENKPQQLTDCTQLLPHEMMSLLLTYRLVVMTQESW